MSQTMKTMMVVLGLSLCGVTTVGCGSGAASVVRRGAYSGELALTGTIVESHYAAEVAMLDHCHGRARIVDRTQGAELAVRDAAGGAAKADDAGLDGAGLDGAGLDGAERLQYVCVSRAPEQD